MSWFPSNNWYDGVNSTVVNDVELNAPYYKWDLYYTLLSPITLYPPLLTSDPPDFPLEDGERVHCMRVMIVPPEKGRCC